MSIEGLTAEAKDELQLLKLGTLRQQPWECSVSDIIFLLSAYRIWNL